MKRPKQQRMKTYSIEKKMLMSDSERIDIQTENSKTKHFIIIRKYFQPQKSRP